MTPSTSIFRTVSFFGIDAFAALGVGAGSGLSASPNVLRTRAHLGSVTWDDAFAGLVDVGGEFAAYHVVAQDTEPRSRSYG